MRFFKCVSVVELVGILLLVFWFVFLFSEISPDIKENYINKNLAISENIDSEQFVVLEIYEENTILLENKQKELFKAESEVLYYHVTGLKLSEVTLDIRVYKDVSYYFLKDTKVVIEKIQ